MTVFLENTTFRASNCSNLDYKTFSIYKPKWSLITDPCLIPWRRLLDWYHIYCLHLSCIETSWLLYIFTSHQKSFCTLSISDRADIDKVCPPDHRISCIPSESPLISIFLSSLFILRPLDSILSFHTFHFLLRFPSFYPYSGSCWW